MSLSDEDLQRLAPFPVISAPGAQAAETWEELRRRPGVAPVLVGNRDAVGFVLRELEKDTGTPQSVTERALKLDLDEWIAERIRSRPEHFATTEDPWDGIVRPMTGFIPSRDHRGDPYAEVFFALVPVDEPWRVPTYLRTAGWNDCPDAVVHTAFFRRWYERYGAEVTTIADGVVEFHVPRPPTTLEDAHVLAREMFVYCPDNLHQGLGTLGNLAGAVLNGPLWYFWWS